jgi:spoIIIJ-associated protein
MSYIDVTAKTEGEAIAKALSQLGLDRDDVSVQILERARSGFLGLGSTPAKIRVTYGEETDAPAEQPAPVKAPEVKAAPAPRTPAPRAEQPAPAKAPEPRPAAAAPRAPAPRTERPKPPQQPRPAVRPAPVSAEEEDDGIQIPLPAPEPLGDEVDDEKAQAIKAFLAGLFQQMDCAAEAHVYLPEKGRYKVILEGENLGALIGRRGETLDAVQQLTSYSVNRTGGRVRIQLDAENYREKREQSLQRLAVKVAGKVIKYRRSVTLEPMNAYERHVIHTALQDVENVTTYSTGTEPNRRVIVAYGKDAKQERA